MSWIDNLYKKINRELKDIQNWKDKYVEKIGEVNYNQMHKIYEQRLQDIRKILDVYVRYLIQDKSNDLKEEDFKDLKYTLKIMKLIENEAFLV